MIVVGLTGGIASGKSFVVSYLKKINIKTHESDQVVSDLYKNKNKKLILFLKKNGFEKALEKKKINKRIIRNEILNNNDKRNNLEMHIHKEVKKNRDVFLKKYKNQKIVFIDIPLLFEKKLETICSCVCSTIAPINIRQKRALKRPGMTTHIFKKIIKNQVTDKTRKQKSQFIINTSKTKTNTYLQIDNILYDILKKYN